jgi:hypothetical protein
MPSRPLLFLLVLGIFGWGTSNTPADQTEIAAGADWHHLTGFSWDRVPVYLHLGDSPARPLTEEQLDFIAQNFTLVALEKSHGLKHHATSEQGIYATARALKARNPAIKVLFYFNAFINWQPYEAFERYDEAWTLRDRQGEIVTHPSGTPRPDLSLPAMREWWVDTVARAMREAPLDGVFVDALPQLFAPDLERQLGQEQAQAVRQGAELMINLTKARLGPERLVLANGTRGERFREILHWAGIDGVMIEHFGVRQAASSAEMRADLETFALAEAQGKFVALKGWPGFMWIDQDMMRLPEQQLLQLARERINFPLACFLVAATPGAWFCYSWGYRSHHGMLAPYAEFDRPLGPPLGDAHWEGYVARREFQHAAVWVDLAAREARIDWYSPGAVPTPAHD